MVGYGDLGDGWDGGLGAGGGRRSWGGRSLGGCESRWWCF